MSEELRDITPSQRTALKIATELIEAGIPVFSAAPDPDRPGEYFLPRRWEQTVASGVWLERWQPGHALAAVGGHVADFLDIDPRNGGLESERELQLQGHMPRAYAVQSTPSGGRHYLISPTGERKSTGFMPGVDLQAGAPDGRGRGFVWIAPTVRPSKAPETLGQLREYVWEKQPDLELLAEYGGAYGHDDSLTGLLDRVHASRLRKPPAPAADAANPFLTASQAARAGAFGQERGFTLTQAQDFVRPSLMRLADAPIGVIEERCNDAAATLSHFVPSHWSADEAMGLLEQQLANTAYDPNGPSNWSVEKFRAVLDGSRPVLGDPWQASVAVEAAPVQPEQALAAAVESAGVDEVDALLAEMLTLEQISERPAPKYLIKGLLNLDSESWMIGAPGCKKSFVALSMAMAVATGSPWQGLKVTSGDVVLIAAEGAGGLSNRIKAWRATYGPLPRNVRVLPRPVQARDARGWAVLVKACERLKPSLVVVDTQARVTVGLEENSATDMGYYVAAVGALRAVTQACVLSIHHTGRAGGDARGSSAIDGAQDTELKVVKKTALTGELRTEKQKDLTEREPMALAFRLIAVGVDEDGDEITSLVLATPDPFSAAGQAEELEEWETGHAVAIVQLFKVLRDQGGTVGLTKAEARTAVVERFYSGEQKRLSRGTYYTAWTRAREKQSASGDPVMVNVSGEKWVVDQVALESLTPVQGTRTS